MIPALAVMSPAEVMVPMLVRLRLASMMVVPLSWRMVEAPPKLTLLVVVVKYVEEIVPILERFPLLSMRCVPLVWMADVALSVVARVVPLISSNAPGVVAY